MSWYVHKTSHCIQDTWGELIIEILWYLHELETSRDGGRVLSEFFGPFINCKQLDLEK